MADHVWRGKGVIASPHHGSLLIKDQRTMLFAPKRAGMITKKIGHPSNHRRMAD
jgi:hypothetical protein